MKKYGVMLGMMAFLLAAVTVGCKREKAPAVMAEPSEEAPESTPTPPTPPAEPKPAEDASAGAELKTFRYVVEYSNPAQGEKMRLEYLADDKRFNIVLSMGGKISTQLISDGTALYMLQPESKMAMKMPREEGEPPEGIPAEMLVMPAWTKFQEEHKEMGFNKKGESELNGKKVTLYETKVANIKISYFVDDQNIIRRIQAVDPSGKDLYTMDIIEFDPKPQVSDADFKVPQGYQLHDMSQMMKSLEQGKPMPEAPEAPPAPEKK